MLGQIAHLVAGDGVNSLVYIGFEILALAWCYAWLYLLPQVSVAGGYQATAQINQTGLQAAALPQAMQCTADMAACNDGHGLAIDRQQACRYHHCNIAAAKAQAVDDFAAEQLLQTAVVQQWLRGGAPQAERLAPGAQHGDELNLLVFAGVEVLGNQGFFQRLSVQRIAVQSFRGFDKGGHCGQLVQPGIHVLLFRRQNLLPEG